MDTKIFIKRKRWLFAVFFTMLPFLSIAQNPGDVEQSYGSATTELSGFNGPIGAIAIQSDGKMIVGGNFTSYRGINENRIVRLNPDGSKDTSFLSGTGFDAVVYAVSVQPDGKIILGGLFNTYQGVAENKIIRLNPDGTKDIFFNTGTGFNNIVNSQIIQPDGKIIVGGTFNSYDGMLTGRIIRLNSDGTKDNSFNTGTGFNESVYSLALQPDGKILIAGNFSLYNGSVVKYVIRLHANGDNDTSFNTGTGFDAYVFELVLQSDGKIICGGGFVSYNGVSEISIIRLNNDGTKDTSFNTGTGLSMPPSSIVVQPDGKLIICGNFNFYNNVEAKKIVRLNTNGTKDATFNVGTSFNDVAGKAKIQPDGKIIVGGAFTSYNGLPANRIIRLNTDGTKDTSFGTSSLNNSVSAITPQTDGKIIVGGSFTAYKGITENHILRLNADATKDNTFNTGTGFDASLYATTLQNDGKIIVGGYFTVYKGITENRIVRLNPDGTKDASFNTGNGFNNSVKTAVVQPDGKILVGGSFTSYNGSVQNDIIRLNPNGTKDTYFNIGSGFNSPVESIFLQPDGKIIVGGGFTSYDGTTANRIIRLNPDGTKDVTFNVGTGFDNSVFTIALQPDGKIIMGGEFITYKGIIERSLIRLNPDGTKDTSFTIGTGFNYNVYTATLQSNGKIIIGGNFTTFNGNAQNGIVCLNPNGTKDSTFTVGSGFNEYVNTIMVHTDGKISVGGGFTSYNNSNSSAYLITLHGDAPLSNEDFVEKNTISLWPNPVQKNLNISNINNITTVKIFDLQGKLVYENPNTTNIVDVSSFASGLYIVQLQTETQAITKKFIKA